jgi:muramoyltetrapeptide carboxypeptidase
VVPADILERRSFTAGSSERRLRELHAQFADDSIAGIFCARGGAGIIQLLPQLDMPLLRAHPKVFVGYSDVTFLHTLLCNAGQVTFHGAMVARDLSGPYHRESLLAAVCGDRPPYSSEEDELLPLREGAAEGLLLGGCLSILASALGTPWALRPPDADVLLLLEDLDEPPYRIDRLLRQLRAAGLFERVRGIVLGDFPGCSPPLAASFALQDVVLEALAGLELPIALGLSTGHTPHPNITLPLGVRARLECMGERASFSILETAVE